MRAPRVIGQQHLKSEQNGHRRPAANGEEVVHGNQPSRRHARVGLPQDTLARLHRHPVQQAGHQGRIEAVPQIIGGRVAGHHLDPVANAGGRDERPGHFQDRRQVQDASPQTRIALQHQHGIGAGAPADVRQHAMPGEIDGVHQGPGDPQGALVHPHHELPGQLRVPAQQVTRSDDRLAVPDGFGKAHPHRVGGGLKLQRYPQ